MYEATITLFESQLRIEQENIILKAVKEIGIDVDKEELLKALKYDREQYAKGYKDGYIDGIKKLCDRLGTIVEHSGIVIELLEEIKERF